MVFPVLRALSVDDGAPEHHLRHGMPSCAKGRSKEAAVANVAKLLQIETVARAAGRRSLSGRPAGSARGRWGRALVRDPLLFLFDEPPLQSRC